MACYVISAVAIVNTPGKPLSLMMPAYVYAYKHGQKAALRPQSF